jgi:hypothetical protein
VADVTIHDEIAVARAELMDAAALALETRARCMMSAAAAFRDAAAVTRKGVLADPVFAFQCEAVLRIAADAAVVTFDPRETVDLLFRPEGKA